MAQASQQDLLANLYSQYPGLKRFGIQTVDSSSTGMDWRGQPYAGRKMEFYPPDESYNPKPGKPTIEVFSKDVGGKDALGEIFSHLLPKVDPDFRDARSKFIASIDPKQKEMLAGDYRQQIRSGLYQKGKQPTFEQWLNTNGGDAFFRGYIADQYPKEFYRSDQVDIFKPLLTKLSMNDQTRGISVSVPGFDKPIMFPAGMTPEQIQHAIETDILPNRPAKPVAAPEQQPIEGPNVAARFGRGMMDIGQGLKQRDLQLMKAMGVEGKAPMIVTGVDANGRPIMVPHPDWVKAHPDGKTETADNYTAKVNDELALYNKGRQAQGGGIDLARIAGNIVATAPAGLLGPGGASVAARAASGAISGGLSSAAQFTPSGGLKDTAVNTAVGAGVGAVAAPVIGWATDKGVSLARKLAGRLKGVSAGAATADDLIRDIPELAELPEQAQRDLIAEAQSQLKTTGSLDSEALARKANLLAQGVTPTKSMVTRSPKDWTVERNLQKLSQSPDDQVSQVGQELTSVYQANDKALTGKLGEMSKGLPAGTQEAHGMAAMQSLDDLATASQKDVSKIYEGVRAARGDQLASDAQQLASTLDDLKDNTYAEKLVSSVSNKLRRFGMLDKEGNLTKNTLTVTQAEELRKFVNTLPNDFGKGQIIRAIDADVMQGLGDDAFGTARGAAQARFKVLDNPATQRALNTLGELGQGKTAQNFIKSQVVDAADQDVASLVSTLQKVPPKKMPDGSTIEAIDSLRAGILQHLQDKAINPNSGQFSGASLAKEIRNIGETKLIRILGVKQFQQLQNLSRAALDATYQPAYSAVNASNTAPMLLSLMQKARAIPGVPILVTDEAAKIAARSGYKSQLADALAARGSSELPQLPSSILDLAQIARLSGSPASAAFLNALRQKADKEKVNRQK